MHRPQYTTSQDLISAKTTTGAGTEYQGVRGYKTYQADGVVTAATGASVVLVQGSNNNGLTWDTIGTITLTLGTSRTSDSFTSSDRYELIRGNVQSISGTGASVNLVMGY